MALTLEKSCPNPEKQETVRLSDVISAMSFALDITEGQPEGHAIKSCMIGMKIADVIRLSDQDRTALFYALLLKDLGCSSNAAKMCWLFEADDRKVKRNVKLINWTNLFRNGLFAFQNVKPDATFFEKLKTVFGLATQSKDEGRKLIKVRCERGAEIVRMLGFPEATAQAILCLDEHWNGHGYPLGLKGDRISLLGRICCLAQTIEVFHSSQGINDAVSVAKRRKNKWFDPDLVDAFLSFQKDQGFWSQLSRPNLQADLNSILPNDSLQKADQNCLDRIALAFSKVVDAKSPWTYRHSEGVATIARSLSAEIGMPLEKQNEIHRAGLLHDIGKLGVSNLILDKQGKLTEDEFSQMKKHAEYTDRILKRVSCFTTFSRYAAAHHERIDGRGYHLGLSGEAICLEARILAVADVVEALSANRPYRPGMPPEKIISILKSDSGSAFCPSVVDAFMQLENRESIFDQVTCRANAIDEHANRLLDS